MRKMSKRERFGDIFEKRGEQKKSKKKKKKTSDGDSRLLAESTLRVKMIVQNNSTSHTTKTEHVGVVGVEPLVSNHILANRSHQSQSSSQVILRNRAVLRQKVGGGLVDDVHHGSGVGKEERHAVSKFVLDGDFTVVLLGELHAVQGTTVVGEIVLEGRR